MSQYPNTYHYVVKTYATRTAFETGLNDMLHAGYSLQDWKWAGDYVAVFLTSNHPESSL